MKLIFETSEQEKKEILEQHNLIKRILQSKLKKFTVNEQVSQLTGRELLVAAKDKCKIALGGTIKSAPGKPSVIYKKADYDSKNGYFKVGDELYIKDDYTFDVVVTDSTGKKTKTFTGKKWVCSALNQEKLDNESKIASEIKKGWKKIETLKSEGVDLTTLDKVYDKITIGTTVLYRPKGSSTTFTPGTSTQDFNNDQQSFVDKFEKKGYILNPTRLEQSTMVAVTDTDLGAPPDLFPNGLTMFYDPNKQSEMKGRDGSELGDIIANQSIDRNVCRKNIDDFYKSFTRRNSIKIDPATINKAKRIVQACKDQHYGKWGIAGGGNRLDKYLDILSGAKSGGPRSSGSDSSWRIK
jgi:hypothetical protein